MITRYIIVSRFNSDIGLSQEYHITDSLTEKWIAYRMEIFNRFTRKSLEFQTNQEFLCLLTFHPDSTDIIQKELLKYPPLPSNIVFTSDKKSLIENYILNADQLYLSNLDSDDMYHPKFIQFLHDHKVQSDKPLLIYKNGYIFNTNTGIINNYYCQSPPFFTEVFDVKDYLSYAMYYPPLAHGYMEYFAHETILDPMFIVILHNRNTWPNYRYHVAQVFQDQQVLGNWQEILKEYLLI